LTSKPNWQAEANQPHRLLVSIKDQLAGQKWIEWRVRQTAEVPEGGSVTCLSQTIFFSPRGLPGFLYWYLFYPFHFLTFRGLIKSIVKRSETHEI